VIALPCFLRSGIHNRLRALVSLQNNNKKHKKQTGAQGG
jgi:hypothetical protein